jgi:indole-3-glycerol phosphate synthase
VPIPAPLYDAWLARKRAEGRSIAHLDARAVTPSVRDLGAALRMGRRDLVCIPTLAVGSEAAAREAAARADAAGCAALAVVTDLARGGSLAAMRAASEAAGSSPVLRVDLVIAVPQVYETRLAEADLARLAKATHSTRMTPVFLVHGEADLAEALVAGARFLLVSAERLDGRGEDLEGALALCAHVPPSVSLCLSAPSLTTPEAVRSLVGKVDGVLLSPFFPPDRWATVAVLE